MEETLKKPSWIKVRFPGGETWKKVDKVLARRGLHTVCDEAHCPNKGECWGRGTATFMILGDTCTRNCRFCAVSTAAAGTPAREDEARDLALAIEELALQYAVLTSVDRDDLPDRGAEHFARCIAAIKKKNAACKVEALIPDYFGDELAAVICARPDTIAHNIETVPSMQKKIRDSRASFDKSLRTLAETKNAAPAILTKSSILLGLGETEEELVSTMEELRSVGTDILVMGQYLRPSPKQIPVAEYVTPETFSRLGKIAREKGFASVVSAPLARTSYHALDAYTSLVR